MTTSLAKRDGDKKNCEWIYRFPADPGMRWGMPTPFLESGPALASCARVALSSAQAHSVYLRSHPACKLPAPPLGMSRLAGLCFASDLGLRKLSFPLGPDRLTMPRQFVRQGQVADRAVQPSSNMGDIAQY